MQWLTFFIDPLLAAQTTFLIFYVLGYLGCLLFFRRALGYSNIAAHLGALAFTLNGFAFANLFVGHLTHHSYLLAPYVLYFLFKKSEPNWVDQIFDIAAFALIWIYCLWSGGLHILVVFAFVVLLGLPLALAQSPFRYRELGKLFLVTSGLLILSCSGKVVVGTLYGQHFFHEALNRSNDGLFTQINRYFWFSPERTPASLHFGKYDFGMWEYVGYVTKVSIPALIVLLCTLNYRERRQQILLGSYLILISAIFMIAFGSDLAQLLPGVKGYHNPIKILGAFIPFLIWTVAYAIDLLSQTKSFRRLKAVGQVSAYVFMATILLAESAIYMNVFVQHRIGIGYAHNPKIYSVLKQNGLHPVSTVNTQYQTDAVGLALGSTSLKCYEPLLGYRLQNFKSSVVAGDTNQVTDSKFNLNHPGCLLYPDFYHCQAWDRIPASETESFQKFTHGLSGAWPVPGWQTFLYTLNFLTIAIIALTALSLALIPKITQSKFAAPRK